MMSMSQDDFDTKFNPLFTLLNHKKSSVLNNELKISKSENKQLKEELNNLKKQLLFKDKLLDSKSKQIINSTSKNLRLQQQLESLKKKLKKTKRTNKKNKKKLSKMRAKNKPLQITPIIKRQSPIIKRQSPIIKRQSPIIKRQSFELVDDDANNEYEMPYFMPSISTSISASSNLSAQAVSLSFPNNKSINTSIDTNHVRTSTINMLSPIAESNTSDNMPTLITSNDNKNIQNDEWKNCVATIESIKEPSISNESNIPTIEGQLDTNNINLQDSDDSDDSDHDQSDDDDNETVISGHSNDIKNMQSSNTVFSDDGVSYMSDNTMLLLDMHYMELYNNSPPLKGNKERRNRCDAVINSPFKLMNPHSICNI